MKPIHHALAEISFVSEPHGSSERQVLYDIKWRVLAVSRWFGLENTWNNRPDVPHVIHVCRSKSFCNRAAPLFVTWEPGFLLLVLIAAAQLGSVLANTHWVGANPQESQLLCSGLYSQIQSPDLDAILSRWRVVTSLHRNDFFLKQISCQVCAIYVFI